MSDLARITFSIFSESLGVSKIFVSYSSKDSRVADQICAALEAKGLACWIASRDVNPGENFGEAIVNAIRAAKLMLLVFTQNANNSDEIKKELVLAGHNRLIVVPVRVEDVVPGGAFAYELATRQWIDLFEDWDRAIEQLGTWIHTTLSAVNDAPVVPAEFEDGRDGGRPRSGYRARQWDEAVDRVGANRIGKGNYTACA